MFSAFITCCKHCIPLTSRRKQAESNRELQRKKGRRKTEKARARQKEREIEKRKQNVKIHLLGSRTVRADFWGDKGGISHSIPVTPAFIRSHLLRDTDKQASTSIQPHKFLSLWLTEEITLLFLWQEFNGELGQSSQGGQADPGSVQHCTAKAGVCLPICAPRAGSQHLPGTGTPQQLR